MSGLICHLCQRELKNTAALSNHFKSCEAKYTREQALKKGVLFCDYGCGQIAHYQFGNGQACCSQSTSSCPGMQKKNSLSHQGKKYNWPNGHPRGMKGKIPWNKGLTIDEYEEVLGAEKVRSYRQNLRNSLAGKNPWERMSETAQTQSKERLREVVQQRYSQGWMPKAGRCKKIWYASRMAGIVRLDGFWELLIAIYFDVLKLHWIRNTEKFEYSNLKGKASTYTPDFYINEWHTYIEIKGYRDRLSQCKQRQFKYPLEMWGKVTIRRIEKFLDLKVDNLRQRYQRSNNVIHFGEVLERL